MSFHAANNCSILRFDREGLCQVRNSCFVSFVPDEDLRGQNVARCSYLLRESSTQVSYMKP